MRAYTVDELLRLTRNELFALHAKIVTELDDMPETSPERQVAYETLRLIRRILAQIRLAP